MDTESERRERLDQALVTRGLAPTRSRARDLVLRGHVTVNGALVKKPAMAVPEGVSLEVSCDEAGDVSRGAVKLRAALEAFAFDAKGRVCLDVGASTGGFTQALLAAGASRVYAVDVGRGQLVASLRDDPRVVSLEGTDARSLTPAEIGEPPAALVADVSFISLTKALGAPLTLAARGAWLVALIKPQFEAGRDAVGKGGIVRDEAVRLQCVDTVQDWLLSHSGWRMVGTIPSPIEGGSGNKEYLIGAVFDA